MAVKIQKWGNSMGLRIPKSIIEKIKLNEGSEVELEVKNGAILITPVKKEYNLDKLIEQINKDNLHQESNDKPKGKEVW